MGTGSEVLAAGNCIRHKDKQNPAPAIIRTHSNQTDGFCASQCIAATRIPGMRLSMYSSSNEALRRFANGIG